MELEQIDTTSPFKIAKSKPDEDLEKDTPVIGGAQVIFKNNDEQANEEVESQATGGQIEEPTRDASSVYSHLADGFGGQKSFTTMNTRSRLPHLTEEGAPVPIWKIVGEFITQDLTRISLPVILNEPMSTLMKQCEK